HVRFTPESRHSIDAPACPVCAISRPQLTQKPKLLARKSPSRRYRRPSGATIRGARSSFLSAMPPIATERSAAKTPLFDHLVGAGEQRLWHVKAERSRCDQVDNQIELAGLLDRQILLTLQNTPDIETKAAPLVGNITTIGH